MRHRVLKYKLNRTSSHRKALLNNMALALIKHEQISTTLVKAKNLRPFVEKIITLAKKGSLSSKKKLFQFLKIKKLLKNFLQILQKDMKLEKGDILEYLKMVLDMEIWHL